MKNKRITCLLPCSAVPGGAGRGFPCGSLMMQDTMATVIHVSPDGDDTNPGTEQAPLRSLIAARERLRQMDRSGATGIEVRLAGGTYALETPLVLDARDGGTASCPVTWRARDGALVTLSGARRLACAWAPWRDGIWRCRLDAATIPPFWRLFVNGRLQTRARYPNHESIDEARYDDPRYDPTRHKPGHAYPIGLTPWPANDRLLVDPATFSPRPWAHPEDGVAHIFPQNYWGNLQFHLTGRDAASGRLDLGAGGWQINAGLLGKAATGLGPRSAFYVENIFEELDAPGEWYHDRREGWLYLMPEAGCDLAAAAVEATVAKRLVEVRGDGPDRPVEHLRLEGLGLYGTEPICLDPYEVPSLGDWSIHRGGAVFLEQTRDCAVRDCRFEDLGGNAVFVSRLAERTAITGCDFARLGESAICLVGESHFLPEATTRCARCGGEHPGGWGEESTAIPSDCLIENNTIHNLGLIGKQTAGVFVSLARRITIRANTMGRMPRAAICFNDGLHGGHRVEDNEIFWTVLETCDHGPINFWGREPYWCLQQSHGPASHGVDDVTRYARETTVVRHNRFHDKRGWGIDIDDGASNIHVVDNLCVGVSVKLREGDRRVIENNIFIHPANPPGAHVGYEGNQDVFRRNIVVVRSASEQRERDVDWANEGSAGSLVSVIGPPTEGPWVREWDHNCYWSDTGRFQANVQSWKGHGRIAGRFDLDGWRQTAGADRHSVYADPKLEAIEERFYKPLPDSPAVALGFKPFPIEGYGARRTQTVRLVGAQGPLPASVVTSPRVAWFRDAGYGLFVHWQTWTKAEFGPTIGFQEAVERFPVDRFADQVAETGARYVIFTVTHVDNHVPFPLPEMDAVMPGRTCRRDLMDELADALNARGVRLMFYTSWQANGDPDFGARTGWGTDVARWQDTMCGLIRAVAERYGPRLAGWWVDNCRHNKWGNFASGYDFKAMAEALRAGNPDRILAFLVSRPSPPLPEWDHRVAGIADYAAGHLAEQLFISAGPGDGNGLQSHWCNNMDGDWVYLGGERRLRYSDDLVLKCITGNIANGAVFSYGVAPGQEGIICDEAMRQLRVVRASAGR